MSWEDVFGDEEEEDMTDYNDWMEWTLVELSEESLSLSEHIGYTKNQVFQDIEGLISLAEREGLKGCFLKFESTKEPYEDWLGPVVVTPCGYRKTTEAEKAHYKEEEEIEALAKELGIYVADARVVHKLKKKGVI